MTTEKFKLAAAVDPAALASGPAMAIANSLGSLLAGLRAISAQAQSAHWLAHGQPAYGDHLLFDRIYTATNAQVDGVGEKIIGLFPQAHQFVNASLVSLRTAKILSELNLAHPLSNVDQASTLLELIAALLDFLADTLTNAEACGCLTPGLDNLLQGLADVQESHVFLLAQRTAPAPPASVQPQSWAQVMSAADAALTTAREAREARKAKADANG